MAAVWMTGVMALGVVAATSEGQNASADRQFSFAARLMQQGESKLAREAFEQFVTVHTADPRLSDAHYYLALLSRQEGDLAAARHHLDLVAKPLAVSEAVVNLMRGQVRLESGDAAGAVAALEKINPQLLADAETRASWHYLIGSGYRMVGNLPAAARHFDDAAESSSAVRGLALVELGKARIDLKEPTAAIEALTEALRTRIDPPIAAEARNLAADLAYGQKQYDLAADLYRQIIQQHQNSPQFRAALIGLLRALYAAGLNEQLIQEDQAIRKLLPADLQAEALYMLGAAHIRLKQYAAAQGPLLEFHERFGSKHPLAGEVAYLYTVCFYHSDLDGFEKWFATIEKDLKSLPRSEELQYLRAQAAIKREKIDDAIRHLGPLIDLPDAPMARRALLQRAGLYEQLGKATEAAADYAVYAERYGQDPKAMEAGRRAIDLAFSSGNFARVRQLAEPWLNQPGLEPASAAGVRLQYAVALIKTGQPEPALKAIEQLLAESPPANLASLGHFYRGLLLSIRQPQTPQNSAAAVQSLETALRGTLPADQQLEAITLIARLHRLANRDAEAVAAYERLRARQPIGDFDPLEMLWVGRALVDEGRHDIALIWLTSVIDRTDAPPAAAAEAMFLAAGSYKQLEQWDQAVSTYRRLVAFSRGYGDQGRLGLAQSLAGAGQTDEALSEYDGLINIDASEIAATALLESGLIHRELAKRLQRAGDKRGAEAQMTEAQRRLRRVVILYDMPQLGTIPVRALMALGEMAAEAGDRAEAVKWFSQVTSRSPQTPWHSAAGAELAFLDGRRGDGLFVLRKIHKETDDPLLKEHAKRRLGQLGESP